MKPMIDTSMHPCFNITASHHCGRVHLPVAPKCNILCNFCRREYDCLNESRPGVTSRLFSPEEALQYLDKVLTAAGIQPVEMDGFITEGLDAVYNNQNVTGFKRRKNGLAKGCSRQC